MLTSATAVGAGLLLPASFRDLARAQDSTPASGDGPLGVITAPDVRKDEGVTINLAVQKHSATDAIQALVGDFESQTGITVNFEQIPQQQMDQKQRTDLATGTGSYDVIGWFLNPEYIANDWITPIDELRQDTGSTDDALLAIDDFFEPFLGWNQYQGALYGLPFYGESMMMYYNKEEFAEAGIDKAPETVEELEAACKAIKEGGRMAGIALRASQEGNAAVYPWLAWLYGYGGTWVNGETMEIGLDSDASKTAAEQWGHFLRDYGPPDVASYFWNEVQLAMQQEKAAIIMDATNFGRASKTPPNPRWSARSAIPHYRWRWGQMGRLDPRSVTADLATRRSLTA
ncbi:MAG: extracellular solute-binding protein [Thermomicrobiales bacterium]